MTPEELIESGKLELYVYGALTTEEKEEVYQMAKQHTIVKEEIDAIEASLYRLSSYTSPYLSARNYERIKTALTIGGRTINLKTQRIVTYMGYAAAVVLLIGLGITFTKYNSVKNSYDQVTVKNSELENTVAKVTTENEVLNELRNNNYSKVALGGQAVAPDASASIYWDKNTHKVMVDIKNLPEPPEGKVYQVWALTFDPLTPTSIGVLDGYADSNTKIFKIDNVSIAQGFGITLEPAGGSASPTLEQLYTLGKV